MLNIPTSRRIPCWCETPGWSEASCWWKERKPRTCKSRRKMNLCLLHEHWRLIFISSMAVHMNCKTKKNIQIKCLSLHKTSHIFDTWWSNCSQQLNTKQSNKGRRYVEEEQLSFKRLILLTLQFQRGGNLNALWVRGKGKIKWHFEYSNIATASQRIFTHCSDSILEWKRNLGDLLYVQLCNIPRLSEAGWCRGAKRSHSLMEFFSTFLSLVPLFPGARLTLRDH